MALRIPVRCRRVGQLATERRAAASRDKMKVLEARLWPPRVQTTNGRALVFSGPTWPGLFPFAEAVPDFSR